MYFYRNWINNKVRYNGKRTVLAKLVLTALYYVEPTFSFHKKLDAGSLKLSRLRDSHAAFI